MKNLKTITRQGEIQKAQRRLIEAMLQDSLKKTIAGQVGDVDPQRAEEITMAMVAAGQLVPVAYGKKVRGLSFMPVDETTDSTDFHRDQQRKGN